MRRLTDGLSLRQQALFGALLLAVVSIPCSLAGPVFGTALVLALNAALLTFLWVRLKRSEPFPPGPAALDEALLLSGDTQIGAVQAPVRSCDSARINAGPSMLLLAHAALLTLPEGDAGRAIEAFFAPMNMNARSLQARMPLAGTVEQDGVLWQLRRDGSGFRAFACGPADIVLPVCRRIQELRPALLRRTRREEIVHALQEQEMTPLCYAMADVTDGSPVDAVYLGALLPCTALVPWAQDEISALRALRMDVRVPDTLADRLDCTADDGTGLCFVPADTEAAGCVPVPEGMRPSEWIGEQRRAWHILRETMVQTAAVMVGLIIGCAFLQPVCAGFMAALVLVAAMQLPDGYAAEMTGRSRRNRIRLGIMLALVVMGAAAVGLYLHQIGIAGGCGMPVLIPPVILLWLVMCRQACARPLSRLAVTPAMMAVLAAVTAILCGTNLMTAVFALLCGCLVTVLSAMAAMTGK